MIRITVELLPFGDEDNPRLLGIALIANNGTGTDTTGNYQYSIHGKRQLLKGGDGTILGFRRKRDNVWELLRQALNHWKLKK